MNFTPEAVRQQFPVFRQRNHPLPLFFDGPGGSQVPVTVMDQMYRYLSGGTANLGGHYPTSMQTGQLVMQARETVQAFLNAPDSRNIVFGANMTTLTFHMSRILSRTWQAGDEVIVTELDHYANVSSWQQAAAEKGAVVHQARLDERQCTLDVEHLLSLISERTQLIAVTYASNTTGSVVDVRRIIEAAHQVGALVYVDAVHVAPHQLIDVQALECDFLVCSAYKFYGPHVGLLYIASHWLEHFEPYKVEPAPNLGPGRYETGTLNFEGLAGVIGAIEYLAQWGRKDDPLRSRLAESFTQYQRHEQQLCELFLSMLQTLTSVRLYGIDVADMSMRTPTFALRFVHDTPEQIAKVLGQENIYVWNGHFYALGLVRRLGLENQGGVLRIGMMHYNTEAEVHHLFEHLRRFDL
ncbi:cysteine desulfurase-like protein [Vibrio mangrovi]|uniref:Cysteine desulfurase-like protein n=1 Tax=Vibrio mangrovi TaxID=474394 RepID=A0A1Y6IP24_9VIBR|nr:cysteine desulfurase-like protein [Vibrio mangrovi]MDW6003799.1 cysteine desulfurase-like protein [Vibrio mangrovi]SMR99406.1 putative cysteine desulfurase [Vibrio mangrovi]